MLVLFVPATGFPASSAVCGLDFLFISRRCYPSSLYTFPMWGLARDCHVKGFPEFEQFSSKRRRLDRQKVYRVKITRSHSRVVQQIFDLLRCYRDPPFD